MKAKYLKTLILFAMILISGSSLANGLTPIETFNEYFTTDFPDDEFDTIGGLVMHHFGHMPKRGESLRIGRFNFNVQRADSRRLHLLQVTLSMV